MSEQKHPIYFAVYKGSEDDVHYIYIVNIDYWHENECMDDQDPANAIGVELPDGIGEAMEATYEDYRNRSYEELIDVMQAAGFVHNEEFQKFIENESP